MKIQVLPLPTQYDGDRSITPYALIFSEVWEEENKEYWHAAGEQLVEMMEEGPMFTITTEQEVEV